MINISLREKKNVLTKIVKNFISFQIVQKIENQWPTSKTVTLFDAISFLFQAT